MCKICSKLIIKAAEQHYGRRSGVFIFNSEQISYVALVYALLRLAKRMLGRSGLVHKLKSETLEFQVFFWFCFFIS